MQRCRKVLLTGATGFIGRALLLELLDEGYEVTAVGRRRPSSMPADHLRFVSMDLGSDGLRDRLMRVPPHDAIVHLAATPKLARGDVQAMRQLHAGGSSALASTAASWDARFLHISTAFVGSGPTGHLQERPAIPGLEANDYECTKTEAERAVVLACPRRTEVLRPGIVLSALEDSPDEQMLSPLASFLRVVGGGSRELPFLPQPGAPLALCRRSDIVAFIRERLRAEAPRRACFWNMLAPYPPSIVEALATLDLRMVGGRCRASMAPWVPYLSRPLSWDTSGYLREAALLGIPVSPIRTQELRELALHLCELLQQSKETTAHARIA